AMAATISRIGTATQTQNHHRCQNGGSTSGSGGGAPPLPTAVSASLRIISRVGSIVPPEGSPRSTFRVAGPARGSVPPPSRVATEQSRADNEPLARGRIAAERPG